MLCIQSNFVNFGGKGHNIRQDYRWNEVGWVRLDVVRLLWVDQGRIRVPGFFGYVIGIASISYSNGYPVGIDIKGSGNRCERSRG